MQKESECLADLVWLLLKNHGSILYFDPVGFARGQATIEDHTLLDVFRVDTNQVQDWWLQSVLLRDVPEGIVEENTTTKLSIPGERDICPPDILFYQGSQVGSIHIVGEVMFVNLRKNALKTAKMLVFCTCSRSWALSS